MKLITNNFLKKFIFSITLLSLISLSFSQFNKNDENTTATFNKRTPKNDWGKNNIFYLDRHSVNCSAGEALQGFRLFRPKNKLLSYKYVCQPRIPEISTKDAYNASTNLNATAGNKKRSANYLDRHYVNCKNGYALQQFKLGRKKNKINYEYRCVKVNCGPVQKYYTNPTSDGGFETVYLDRQDVRVRKSQVITGFKLISKGGRFKYRVNFCPLKPAPKKTVKPNDSPKNPNQNQPNKNADYNVKKTMPNDWGRGNIYYLDRHRLECPNGSIMQGFHLWRPRNNQISYEYYCKKSLSIVNDDVYSTFSPINIVGGNGSKSTNYLDRHNVRCKDGYALKSFWFARFGGKDIYYQYTCVRLNCGNYQEKITKETSGGDKTTIYLDRQTVRTGVDEALAGFKLVSRYSGRKTYYKYKYTTCKLNDSPLQNSPVKTLRTRGNDWGKGNIYYLDRHRINCPNQTVLQGFHLTRPTPLSISYEYYCRNSKAVTNETYNGKTPANIVDRRNSNSVNYLDRHHVNCKDGFSLKAFYLFRKPNNKAKIYYQFTCVRTNCRNYSERFTKESDGGDKNIVYLDRQDIRVADNEALVGFRLHSRYSGKKTYFKYKYRVCKVVESPPKNDQGKEKPKDQNKPKPNPTPIPPKKNDKPVYPVPINNKGKGFCSRFCQANPREKIRRCFIDNHFYHCRRCMVRATVNDPINEKGKLCSYLCDSINNQPCDLYGYVNNKLKYLSQNILRKYGLRLVQKK